MKKILFLVLAVGVLAGCPPAGKSTLSGSGMDLFSPVSMRVHPLSRLVAGADGKAGYVEARVEFKDQFGDVGKGVGTLTVTAYAYELLLPGHAGKELGKWTVDLNSAVENKQDWESITRTYLLKLPWSGEMVDKVTLKVTLAEPNGGKLSGVAVVSK